MEPQVGATMVFEVTGQPELHQQRTRERPAVRVFAPRPGHSIRRRGAERRLQDEGSGCRSKAGPRVLPRGG